MSENKLAIITGASRGIGYAAAEYFAKENYDLVLLARNEKLLNEVAESIHKNINDQIKITTKSIDVSDTTQVSTTMSEILSNLKRVDVLFNSAGVFKTGTSDANPSDFSDVLDINVKGIFNIIHSVVPTMKKQRSGYIFNLSSMAGKRAIGKHGGAYCASKFAVSGFSDALSNELLEYDVKVTSICPGYVNTDMTSGFGHNPKDMIQVSDIIKTIDYLLSLGPQVIIKDLEIRSHISEQQLANTFD